MAARFAPEHTITLDTDVHADTPPVGADIVLDAFTLDIPTRLMRYQYGQAVIFYNIPKTTLAKVHHNTKGHFKGRLFGFNGLPGLFENKTLELSYTDEADKEVLSLLVQKLSLKAELIADTIGMVSPRILAMIINEAYFTVQEGTANAKDIDTAMRLGTNYPKGPFEWVSAIGIRNVAEVLLAVYAVTGEERYKLAPALYKEYLATQP
jgi:3-hydroxybutyryl-CoA dehydrogenase